MHDLERFIRDIPDFPKKGIVFKDITPLLANAAAFRQVIDSIAEHYREHRIETVVGIESRGFIISAAVAYVLRAGLSIVRKAGRLPHDTIAQRYNLEYGTDTLQMHRDAIVAGARVLLVDDLLATGGTAEAAIELIQRLRGEVVGAAFIIELTGLKGRSRLSRIPVMQLMAI